MARSLKVVGGTIVNEGTRRTADILIEDGRIAAIGSGLPDADQVIDAEGKMILPGVIDDQVHFRTPGQPHKATIASEARAAVRGGVTSFMDMPNNVPAVTTLSALEEKYAHAAGVSMANYSFYLGGSNDNAEEVKRVDPTTICGVKVFMGSSSGNMLVDEPAALRAIFGASPTLIATHCEDTPMIQANEAAAAEKWGDHVPFEQHPLIRSREACIASSRLAMGLAQELDARLHILHITTAEECDLFTPGPIAGKKITAEACVHHLWFCDEDYDRLGGDIKCNPAIKSAADRAAIRAAVVDGRIDVVATDHAPHTRAEKNNPYAKCPAGLPLIQYHLPLLLEMAHQGVWDLETVALKSAHAVADCYRMVDRGYIREGYWADLAIIDTAAEVVARNEACIYHVGWTPLHGQVLHNSIDATIVSGQVAWHNGALYPDVRGRRMDFLAL